MAPFIVKGPPRAGAGAEAPVVPTRLDIRDFVKIEDQFSLYIQALQGIYSDPKDDILSFYKIGGIHGFPFTSWNEVPGEVDGYCQHSSVLFPTWHRPYVSLLEQSIQKRAVEIANTYEVDQARWINAATNLRQPYWDWASSAVPPDEVISLKKVQITKPDGTKDLVDNPFLFFKFPTDLNPKLPSRYSQWATTLRCPTSSRANATSSLDILKGNLNRHQAHLREDTYSLLSFVTTWDAFSNRSARVKPRDPSDSTFINSVESLHDTIHINVGGDFGHMSDPAVAGFDPIFWLHHCQVDRLMSLWSAMHPGVWVSEVRGLNKDTGLTPFWNSPTSHWPSDGVRSTSTFNYTYPEFKGAPVGNPSALDAHITGIVDRLYGNSALGLESHIQTNAKAPQLFGAASVFEGAVGSIAGITTNALAVPTSSSVPSPSAPAASSDVPTAIPYWTARIRCSLSKVESSFSVLLFLGDVPEDSTAWTSSPSFIGASDVFVNTVAEKCANCSQHADQILESFVDLNTAILKHSELGSLKEEDVAPYLQKNLSWKVKKIDDTPGWVPSLEVLVLSTPLKWIPGASRPIAGVPQHLRDITSGRSGGSQPL